MNGETELRCQCLGDLETPCARLRPRLEVVMKGSIFLLGLEEYGLFGLSPRLNVVVSVSHVCIQRVQTRSFRDPASTCRQKIEKTKMSTKERVCKFGQF
jgi:hypothetical protein